MRLILTLVFITAFSISSFSQTVEKTNTEAKVQTQDTIHSFAYISVHGTIYARKLKVKVDFGETPEQIQAGKEYSEKLSTKKSYAAILNYMAENGFQLVETLDQTDNTAGTGGTSGIAFIMRKK